MANNMASISSLVEDQKGLEIKIRNCFSNMMKKGRKNLTMGIIESRLDNLENHWQAYAANDVLINKQKAKRDARLDYFVDAHFDKVEEFYLDSRGDFLDEKSRFVNSVAGVTGPAASNLASGTALAAPYIPQRKMPTIAIPKFSGKHNE